MDSHSINQSNSNPVQPPQAPSGELPQGKFRRSILLTKQALAAIKQDKSLVGAQIVGVIISVIVSIALITAMIAALAAIGGDADTLNRRQVFTPQNIGYIIIFWLVVIGFIIVSTYVSVAVSYGALVVFSGKNVTVKECFAAANRRFSTIVSFSAISGTIGVALNALEERVPFFGKLALRLVGAAWSIATMFVPAAIANSAREGEPRLSGIDAVKKSVGVLKKSWGVSIIVTVGVGLASSLIFLAILAAGTVLMVALASAFEMAGLGIGFVLMMLAFVAVAILFSTLGAIVNVALYQYATTGKAPMSFSPALLQSVIEQKPQKGLLR